MEVFFLIYAVTVVGALISTAFTVFFAPIPTTRIELVKQIGASFIPILNVCLILVVGYHMFLHLWEYIGNYGLHLLGDPNAVVYQRKKKTETPTTESNNSTTLRQTTDRDFWI